VELWIEIKQLNDVISDLMGSYDEKGVIEKSQFRTMEAKMMKVALLSRAVAGVDELTDKSLSLFSSPKEYKNLADMELEVFEKMHDEANETPKRR
jgi:hypothetical protein